MKAGTATLDPETLVETQLALGQMHLDRGEPDQALEWFRAAARSGDARALNMLGRAYERGWGMPVNAPQAAVYFREAAERGDVWAMFNLADLYCRGVGVERDETTAYALYAEAARRGHAKSLNMLGLFHEDGSAVLCDLDKAFSFFQAGAEAGDCWAQFNAARLALSRGATDEALRWLAASLETGFTDYFVHLAAALEDDPDPRLSAIGRKARQAAGKGVE